MSKSCVENIHTFIYRLQYIGMFVWIILEQDMI
jgi:hypothetical protein